MHSKDITRLLCSDQDSWTMRVWKLQLIVKWVQLENYAYFYMIVVVNNSKASPISTYARDLNMEQLSASAWDKKVMMRCFRWPYWCPKCPLDAMRLRHCRPMSGCSIFHTQTGPDLNLSSRPWGWLAEGRCWAPGSWGEVKDRSQHLPVCYWLARCHHVIHPVV